MDYLGWELERQRAALTALLLGGEKDGETVRDGERRSLAEPETAWEYAGGDAGRYAGGGGYRRGSEEEPVLRSQEARLARWPVGGGTAGRPSRAWEAVLGEEETDEGTAGDGGGAETGVPAGAGEAARRAAEELPGGGTGAQAEQLRFSGKDEAQREVRRTAAEDAAGTIFEAAERAAGRDYAGERPAGRTPENGESTSMMGFEAGENVGRQVISAGQNSDAIARNPVYGAGPVRRSGGGRTRTLGQDREPAVSFPWGGDWETAALREEDSARALSRAVQRDARRYDGGFAIY